MDNYKVIAMSIDSGERFELLNVQTTPTKVYQAAIIVGPNTSEKDEVKIFELFVNGTSTGNRVNITVLCKDTIKDLANKINCIIDSIWWYNFNHETNPTFVHLDPEIVTFEEIIQMVIRLDDSFGWHTFDKVEDRDNNLITYDEVVTLLTDMSRLSMVKFIDGEIDRVHMEPHIDGQIIFTRDGRLYWDAPGAEGHISISEIIEVPTSAEFDRIKDSPDIILNKFYFIRETGDLYRYIRYNNQGWQLIGATLANENKHGLMSKELFKKLTDIILDSDEPDADSTDNDVTTSARLWKMLGSPLQSLVTNAKTIVGAINELFEKKIGSPDASVAGRFLLSPQAQGDIADTVPTSDFIKSPEAKTDGLYVMIAPAVKGEKPILRPLSSFAYTEGGENLIVPNDKPSYLKSDCNGGDVGSKNEYARADHRHPLNASNVAPKADAYYQDGYIGAYSGGSSGSSTSYSRSDHSHPLNVSEDDSNVKEIDEDGSLGVSKHYARADHSHKFGNIGEAKLGVFDKTAMGIDITSDDTLKLALAKLQCRIKSNENQIEDLDNNTGQSSNAFQKHIDNNDKHLPPLPNLQPDSNHVLRGDNSWQLFANLVLGSYPGSYDMGDITINDSLGLALRKLENNVKWNNRRIVILENSKILNCTKGEQLITLDHGIYDVECYGAQGGGYSSNISDGGYSGGLGGVVSARFTVSQPTLLYCYVGESPTSFKGGFPHGGSCPGGGYNAGGGYGGGGCTFISTVPLPNQANSLFINNEFAALVNVSGGYNNKFTIGYGSLNGTVTIKLEFAAQQIHYARPNHQDCIVVWITKNGEDVMSISGHTIPNSSDNMEPSTVTSISSNGSVIGYDVKLNENTCRWESITKEVNGTSRNFDTMTFTGNGNVDDIWGVRVLISGGHNTSYVTKAGESLSGPAFAMTLLSANGITPVTKRLFTEDPLICAGGGGGASNFDYGVKANIATNIVSTSQSEYYGSGENSSKNTQGAGGSGYHGGKAASVAGDGGKGGLNYVVNKTTDNITITNAKISLSTHCGDGMIKITRVIS